MIDVETFRRNCKTAHASAREAAEERSQQLRELTALCSLAGYKHDGPGNSVQPGSSAAYGVSGGPSYAPLTVFDSDGNIVVSGPADEVLFMLVED